MAELSSRRRRFVLSFAILAAAGWFAWGIGWLAPDSPIRIFFLAQEVRRDQSIDCAEQLGDIGPKARSAIPTLLAATKVDGWLAESAAIALWKIDRETNVLVEVFSNRMATATRSERSDAFLDFARLGRDLMPAASVVEQALFDGGDTPLRDNAAAFLKEFDPERLRRVEDRLSDSAAALLPLHIAALQSTNKFATVHADAIKAIQAYGPAGADAIPALLSELRRSGRNGEPLGVLRALAAMGPKAVAATPDLAVLAGTGSDTWLARQALAVLGSIGPGASNALPAVEFCLTNSARPEAQLDAAIAWSQIDPNDKMAITALRKFQTNGDPGLLDRVDHDPSKIDRREYCVNNLSQTRMQVQIRASVALWRLGLEPEPPLPAIMAEAAHDGVWAIELLGDIGPPAREALPILKLYLGANDGPRCQAGIAILKIDPAEARRLGLPGLMIACPDTYFN